MLGITDAAQLALNPLRGALFESWVVGEYLKAGYNAGRGGGLSFWRDRSGLEVDLLREVAERLADRLLNGAIFDVDYVPSPDFLRACLRQSVAISRSRLRTPASRV